MAGRSSIANGFAALLCTMLVLFPKGGFRFGPVPLTWGYLLLFVALLIFLPYRLLACRSYLLARQLLVLLCLVPFLLVVLYTFLAFGSTNMGGLVSTITSLGILPLLFLWFFPPLMRLVDTDLLLLCFRRCVLLAALFGILLFVWRPVTGHWIQVPYLTVNAGDASDFESTKNISRGYFFKLISTYNNGNIYGASTLIVLSLYEKITQKRWQRWTVWLALFLTLSRTVWAGMVFYLLLTVAADLVNQRRSFPVVRLGRVVWIGGTLLLLLPLFLFASDLFTKGGAQFLLDPTLGGRTEQFNGFGSRTFFPFEASPFFFSEVIYFSAVNLYGYIGLPTITLVLASPLLAAWMDPTALHNPYRRAALKGLILYALISTSDGALNLIPVMAFYWFAYMVFIFGLPTRASQAALSAASSPSTGTARLTPTAAL